jgi:acyl-CoA thioester hydrolase
MRIYRRRFTVPDDAIDENGHANNVEYVRWMQDIAVMHSIAVGFGHEQYQKLGVTWVVRSHNIEYLGAAFRGDEITVFTWVSTMGRSQSLRKYKFVREADGKVLARAETSWVYLNAASGRPRAIHDELGKAFEVVPESEEP